MSAKISGSRLILEVQENETYQHEKEEEPGASDFISDKSGIIVSMITRSGTPVKKTGDLCKKGKF